MKLVTTDRIQYYLKAGDTFVRVSEDSAFDPKTDLSTYEPSYKDRMNQPSFVTGKKTSVEFDIDIVEEQALQEFFMAHEDDVNVPVDLVRVMMFRPVFDATDTTKVIGYEAKKAAFSMTQNPLDGSAGEVIKATGTLTMSSDGWTEGTFDIDTKSFAPAVVTP